MAHFIDVATIENEGGKVKNVPYELYIEFGKKRGWKLLSRDDQTKKVDMSDAEDLTSGELVDMLQTKYNMMVPKGRGHADLLEMVKYQRVQAMGRKVSEDAMRRKQEAAQYGRILEQKEAEELSGLKQWHELKKLAKSLAEKKEIDLPTDLSADSLAEFIRTNK